MMNHQKIWMRRKIKMINKTKRLVVSRSVKIARKEHFWAATPTSGRHNKEDSVPLLIVMRDYLKHGDKEREVTRMLNNGLVKVDGKVVKNRRTALGFLDVISIDSLKLYYRILFDNKGRLIVLPEDEKNSTLKPKKVTNKITVTGGKTQLVFNDGENLITEEKGISTGDVVLMKLPEKKIDQVLKMQPGNKAFLTGGEHVGSIGTIKKIEIKESSGKNLIHFEEGFTTVSDYAFVVGSPKYTFHLPGGEQ